MATALSIIATAVALVSLAVSLRREWLDRPQVHLSANPMTTPDGHGEIVALVENHGRQPALVKEIGLEWTIEPGSLPGGSTGRIVFNDPWARVRIEPGGHHEVRWEPDRVHCHADMPIRAFADFGARRRAWTKPLDYFRLLLVLGWKPNSEPPSEWLRAPSHVVPAEPIAPSWKRWRPKHQRMATPAPRFEHSSDELAELVRQVVENAGD